VRPRVRQRRPAAADDHFFRLGGLWLHLDVGVLAGVFGLVRHEREQDVLRFSRVAERRPLRLVGDALDEDGLFLAGEHGQREGRLGGAGDDLEEQLHGPQAPLRLKVKRRQAQALGAHGGAAVPLRQRAQSLEPARHGGREAPLASDARNEELVLRRRRLVRPVRTAQLLDRLVRRPGQLERDVDAAALVADAAVGLERDARRGGLGDDGDELASGLELSLFEHVLHVQRLAVPRAPLLVDDAVRRFVAHHAALAARKLGDFGRTAEVGYESVQRIPGQAQRVRRRQEAAPHLAPHRVRVREVVVVVLDRRLDVFLLLFLLRRLKGRLGLSSGHLGLLRRRPAFRFVVVRVDDAPRLGLLGLGLVPRVLKIK